MANTISFNYAPLEKPKPVVGKGEFAFAVASMEHNHIYEMSRGLIEAGATLKWAYDVDPAKIERFLKTYPDAKPAPSLDAILQDPEVQLVAAAAIPNERGPLGVKVMEHGKDYFTDKTPFTSLEHLAAAKEAVKRTGKKYAISYSERLDVESSVYAGQLIKAGAIGRVVQVLGIGPHRLNTHPRPAWFYKKEQYGGIICDIGSHQVESFLYYADCKDAKVVDSKVANYNNKHYPELEDFGDVNLVGDNGATNYFRVDWLSPTGLSTWGDGRMFILGTKGYIELRKYVDIAREQETDHVYIVNDDGERQMNVKGLVGFPHFGELILDCINRTEIAMTQEHAFKAAEICLLAQKHAVRVE